MLWNHRAAIESWKKPVKQATQVPCRISKSALHRLATSDAVSGCHLYPIPLFLGQRHVFASLVLVTNCFGWGKQCGTHLRIFIGVAKRFDYWVVFIWDWNKSFGAIFNATATLLMKQPKAVL